MKMHFYLAVNPRIKYDYANFKLSILLEMSTNSIF